MVGTVTTTTITHTVTSGAGWLAKDYTTAMVAFVIGCATILIALAQMKIAKTQKEIASAKLKLDLYNKRFAVFQAAIELYHATLRLDEPMKSRELKLNEFVKPLKESIFLFNKEDEIYQILDDLQVCVNMIVSYEEAVLLKKDQLTIDKLKKQASDVDNRMQVNLETLVVRLEKYLQFKTVSGHSDV